MWLRISYLSTSKKNLANNEQCADPRCRFDRGYGGMKEPSTVNGLKMDPVLQLNTFLMNYT